MNNYNKTSLAGTAFITLTTIVTTYTVSKLVSKYGFNGTLRYIWEGDHLPPHIRDAVDTLDDVEDQLNSSIQKKLKKVDVMMEVARLNSVDGGSNNIDNKSEKDDNDTQKEMDSEKKGRMMISDPPAPLIKDLGILSHKLDKLASEVDSVQSCNDAELKTRKKELSSRTVRLMDKVDEYIEECGTAS